MYFKDVFVRTGNCVVVWDGITNPERKTNKDGSVTTIHSLKVAYPSTMPEVAELQDIATRAIQGDKLKGTFPPGGLWPINPVKDGFANDKLKGYYESNTKSYSGAPQVFNSAGQLLDPMQYANLLYPGCIVQVLVHAYDYDDKSKGIAFGIDGIQIMDSTAPRLEVGGKIDATGAFGPVQGAPAPGAPAPGAPAPGAPAPGAPAPPPPHPGILGHQMTALANGVPYESFIAAGWTDETLKANGMML